MGENVGNKANPSRSQPDMKSYLKSENKANQPISQSSTTTHQKRPQIKKRKGSKPVLPAAYKFKKLSQHFKLLTSTEHHPAESKSESKIPPI